MIFNNINFDIIAKQQLTVDICADVCCQCFMRDRDTMHKHALMILKNYWLRIFPPILFIRFSVFVYICFLLFIYILFDIFYFFSSFSSMFFSVQFFFRCCFYQHSRCYDHWNITFSMYTQIRPCSMSIMLHFISAVWLFFSFLLSLFSPWDWFRCTQHRVIYFKFIHYIIHACLCMDRPNHNRKMCGICQNNTMLLEEIQDEKGFHPSHSSHSKILEEHEC